MIQTSLKANVPLPEAIENARTRYLNPDRSLAVEEMKRRIAADRQDASIRNEEFVNDAVSADRGFLRDFFSADAKVRLEGLQVYEQLYEDALLRAPDIDVATAQQQAMLRWRGSWAATNTAVAAPMENPIKPICPGATRFFARKSNAPSTSHCSK